MEFQQKSLRKVKDFDHNQIAAFKLVQEAGLPWDSGSEESNKSPLPCQIETLAILASKASLKYPAPVFSGQEKIEFQNDKNPYFIQFPPLSRALKSSGVKDCTNQKKDVNWEANGSPWSHSPPQVSTLPLRQSADDVGPVKSIFSLPQREKRLRSSPGVQDGKMPSTSGQQVQSRGHVIDGIYISTTEAARHISLKETIKERDAGVCQIGTYDGPADQVKVHCNIDLSDEEERVIQESMHKMVWVRRPYEMPINMLYNAVAKRIGGCNIVAVNPCTDDRLEFMVTTVEFADYLIKQGITVDHLWLQMYRLEDKPVRVVLKGVPPFIPNSVLAKVLARFGKVQERDIVSERIGTFNDDLKHVLSCRRTAWIKVVDEDPLPEVLAIKFGSRVFNIYVTSAHMRCEHCGQAGHAHTFCAKLKVENKRKQAERKKKKEEMKKDSGKDQAISSSNPVHDNWQEDFLKWKSAKSKKVVTTQASVISSAINEGVKTTNTFDGLADEASLGNGIDHEGDLESGQGRVSQEIEKIPVEVGHCPVVVPPLSEAERKSKQLTHDTLYEIYMTSVKAPLGEENKSWSFLEFFEICKDMTVREMNMMKVWPQVAVDVMTSETAEDIRRERELAIDHAHIDNPSPSMEFESTANVRKRGRSPLDNKESSEDSDVQIVESRKDRLTLKGRRRKSRKNKIKQCSGSNKDGPISDVDSGNEGYHTSDGGDTNDITFSADGVAIGGAIVLSPPSESSVTIPVTPSLEPTNSSIPYDSFLEPYVAAYETSQTY